MGSKVLFILVGIVFTNGVAYSGECNPNVEHCSGTGCFTNNGKGNAEKCRCHPGYTGGACQIHLNVSCSDVNITCANNGNCTDSRVHGEMSCECPDENYGPLCQFRRMCKDVPCNNGTCREDYQNVFRYTCTCNDGFTDRNCDKEIDSKQLTMEPTYGPSAGGTLVTLTGDDLGMVKKIYFNQNGSFEIKDNRSSNHLVAESPPYDLGDSPEVSIDLLIKLDNEKVITKVFTFRPNPTISDIYPRKTIKGGGTIVTIKGTSLDAVANPLLTVTAEKRGTSMTKVFTSKRCKAADYGETLRCRAPKIPTNIQFQERQKRSSVDLGISRYKRQQSDNSKNDIDFYFGFKLDGVEDYNNLTKTLPHLAFVEVNPDPTFTEGQVFYVTPDTSEEQVIGIHGENIDSGTVEDFIVLIGKAMCSNIGLTNDKLYCNPPTKIEELGISNNTMRTANEADITVQVGESFTYYVGYIVYEEEATVSLLRLFIPVVAALGALLLIVAIILVVCACRRKSTKSKQCENTMPPSATDLNNQTANGNGNYYTGQPTAPTPNPYYMMVNPDH